MKNEIFSGYGVRIEELSREEFLKVRETMARIGLFNDPNIVSQVCFVLHKKGKYSLLHYKELEMLDGHEFVEITDDDIAVRNTIAYLLSQWKLVTLLNEEEVKSPRAPVGKIMVVPFKKRTEYDLRPMYHIGKKVTR